MEKCIVDIAILYVEQWQDFTLLVVKCELLGLKEYPFRLLMYSFVFVFNVLVFVMFIKNEGES